MADKHDGWAIKDKAGRILLWSFSDTRTELVQEKAGVNWWRNCRRRGDKIVKVKLVEVER